mgnify:CR=1 FL=1
MILEDAEIGQVYNILIGKKTSSKTLKKMILVKQDKNQDYFFLDYKSYNKRFMYCCGTKISFEKIFNKYSDEFVQEYLDEKEKKENQKRIFRETYFKG